MCLFFVVGVVGLLSANCTTELMHRYPKNAGAAAAVFGAMQLALGASRVSPLAFFTMSRRMAWAS